MKTRHLFNDPRNVTRLLHLLMLLCLLLLGLELVVPREPKHAWEEVFGFYGLYGFIGGLLLVLLGREIRRLLMRREDYYGDEPPVGPKTPSSARTGEPEDG